MKTLMAVLIVVVGFAGQAAAQVNGHLRPTDQRAARLVAAGAAKSATFRGLTDTLAGTDVYVLVGSTVGGSCPNGRPACLVFVGGRPGAARFVQVTIGTRMHETDAVGYLAHELQHALEIASDSAADSQDGVAALYRRIGTAQPGAARVFETSAALQVGEIVFTEMQR